MDAKFTLIVHQPGKFDRAGTVMINCGGGDGTVCADFNRSGHTFKESVKLATLAAAAPDMYEALQSIVSALKDREDVYDGPNGEQRPNEAMSMLSEFGYAAEAALAKARGEAA